MKSQFTSISEFSKRKKLHDEETARRGFLFSIEKV
jgi:hypothetical protein